MKLAYIYKMIYVLPIFEYLSIHFLIFLNIYY